MKTMTMTVEVTVAVPAETREDAAYLGDFCTIEVRPDRAGLAAVIDYQTVNVETVGMDG